MGKIVGIDFGTTNSLAAYMDGTARIVTSKNEKGQIERILPSVICKYNGQLYIGKDAKCNRCKMEKKLTSPFVDYFCICDMIRYGII